jgi:hypothetical protein
LLFSINKAIPARVVIWHTSGSSESNKQWVVLPRGRSTSKRSVDGASLNIAMNNLQIVHCDVCCFKYTTCCTTRYSTYYTNTKICKINAKFHKINAKIWLCNFKIYYCMPKLYIYIIWKVHKNIKNKLINSFFNKNYRWTWGVRSLRNWWMRSWWIRSWWMQSWGAIFINELYYFKSM